MRVLLAAAAVVTIAACTFPDVDYADGGAASAGATTTSTATCDAPAPCADTAAVCAADADAKYKVCTHPCKVDAGCLAMCDAQEKTALAGCAAACRGCAASTCGAAPTNCDALVGL